MKPALSRKRQLPAVFACLLAIVLLLSDVTADAVTVEGLYTGSVTVTSRTDSRERNEAFSESLQQVLVKVAGKADVLQLPAIRQAMSSPGDFMESYSYRSSTSDAGEQITIDVKFFESQVQALLDSSAIPLWPSNRPVTLVWMVEQNAAGQRRIIRNDEDVLTVIRQRAAERGMPVLFPLMDLQDIRQSDTERLWNLDANHVDSISSRYAAESVLVIRVFTSLGNEFLGRALFRFRGQDLVQDLYADTLEALVAQPVDLGAEQLADYYAVYLSGIESDVPVQMRVDGIETIDHYAALLAYVNSLADVSDVLVDSVSNSTVTLDLQTGGQIRQLIESIALDRHLQPQAEATRTGNLVNLHYQWRP